MLRYPPVLDNQALEFARDFLNETPEKQKDFVSQIRHHFETHEPSFKITVEDDSIVAFLRGCKYDLQKTITKMKNYYQMRADLPYVFTHRDPADPRMLDLLHLGCYIPLRKFHNGRLVLVVRPAAYDPKQFDITDILKVGYVVIDVCCKVCSNLQVFGACMIIDMKGMTLGHARHLTPAIIRHMVYSWENFHCRPKQIEFINAPAYINVVLNIFKSFMSAKLRQRVRVHFGGFESLHEVIDKSILPEEYGGDDGSYQFEIDFWVRQIMEFREWLLLDEKFTVVKEDTSGSPAALK